MGKSRHESWYEPGRKYGRLTIIRELPKNYRGRRTILFKCDCGNETIKCAEPVFSGSTNSCGCLYKETRSKKKEYNIIGNRYGRLVVIEEVESKGQRHFRCKCDCGKESIVNLYNLINGKSLSCGCLRIERRKELRDEDITGQVFGDLTAIKRVKDSIDSFGCHHNTWLFKCSCGREVAVRKSLVKFGNNTSCGHKRSNAEYEIIRWLVDHNIKFDKEASFDELRNPNTGRKLYFDFRIYRNDGTFFMLEHQGLQHFIKRETYFGKQQREETDAIKKMFCEENEITLHETYFYEDYIAKLEQILKDELEKDGDVYESEVSNG